MSNKLNTQQSYANTAGLNPTAAAVNKWICYLPFKNVLGEAYPNLELQCTQAYLPTINVGHVTVGYQGYTIKVPASTVMNAEDKTIKFQYIVDDEWRNYSALHVWTSKFAQYGHSVDKNAAVANLSKIVGNFATVRVWLLSPFKKRIVDFEFHDCWIQSFGEILLDCSDSKPIKHDFTLSYSDFNIIAPTISNNRISETAE